MLNHYPSIYAVNVTSCIVIIWIGQVGKTILLSGVSLFIVGIRDNAYILLPSLNHDNTHTTNDHYTGCKYQS